MRAVKNSRDQKGKMKRGEKEAISLRRRRLMKNIMNGLTITGICIAFVTTIYLWRSGMAEGWLNKAETTVEAGLVDAGLTVEKVSIEGEFFIVESDVEGAANITMGDPLLGVDISAIKDRVEQLTWVKRATISRTLPDELVINITEHQPAALWQVDNKLWIISDEGIQISDQQLEYFTSLPMISGVGADGELENLLTAVSSSNALFEMVETASWVGSRRWDLILKNGIKIMLPEEEIAYAWKNLTDFESSEKLLARNILAVDFRIKDKTVVRLTPEEAERRRLLAKTGGVGEEI
ncbi:MAG: FtsQ-type POTRA domain-containing protein [Kordiimonadaceae bacterium]|jgi:cell division protein FtsQ|nr:FtsQ-type POTRA domain-containing protein [Kordiimonadaceae bacterium]MBT6036454.1 FtsQ-type POTRA domain-containing protein [Kordiimonadaceae bacterium]MBT7582112.1 FtsQ-type POTRA domain-containing protein [Kordiimonadaceae bacterium]